MFSSKVAKDKLHLITTEISKLKNFQKVKGNVFFFFITVSKFSKQNMHSTILSFPEIPELEK